MHIYLIITFVLVLVVGWAGGERGWTMVTDMIYVAIIALEAWKDTGRKTNFKVITIDERTI